MKTSSYFPVAKKDIIAAANNAIAGGKADQQAEREKQIAAVIKQGIFRTLFLLPNRTRQQAEAIAWGERMLAATKFMVGETANLASEDIEILQSWLNP